MFFTLLFAALAPSSAFAHPPAIVSTSAAARTPTCEALGAVIVPNSSSSATFHFEYLTEAQFKAEGGFASPHTERTSESAVVGESGTQVPVSAEVCGLTRRTPYRFRVVATNSESPPGGTPGPTETFTDALNGPSHEQTATIGSTTSTPPDPYPLTHPTDVAEDPATGDLYVTNAPSNERQSLTVQATGGTFTLAFKGKTTTAIPYDATAAELAAALESLTTIGANIKVSGGPGASVPYQIDFIAALADTDLPQLTANSTALAGSPSTANTSIAVLGGSGADVEKFTHSGQFLLLFGKGVNKTTGANVCDAGEECQPGTPGPATPACGPLQFSWGCEAVTDIAPAQFVDPTAVAVDGSNGDVYVADSGSGLIQKFEPSGVIVSTWASSGQLDGSHQEYAKYFGTDLSGIAALPGALFVRDGEVQVGWLFNSGGGYYSPEKDGEFGLLLVRGSPLSLDPALAFDPASGESYQGTGSLVEHYPATCELSAGTAFYDGINKTSDIKNATLACAPTDTFGSGVLSGAGGLSVEGATHTVYVANSNIGDVAVLSDITPEAITDPPLAAGETTLTLAGHVDPETFGTNHGEITECFFEWGFTTAYGHIAECEPATPYSGPEAVTAELTGLPPITSLPVGSKYHYRLIAANEHGATAEGADQTAITTAPPQIEGVSSSHLTATSAQLDAAINPHGLPTKYRFSYGPTTAYGQSTEEREISGNTAELSEVHNIQVEIEGLQPGATYHFRLFAENELGKVSSEDQSFEFFPPACPNSAVRQQTGSAYLPDCRAYELVSPGNANATLLYPGGPNTGQATSPSRFSYTGAYSSLPGTSTIETTGDLYVATRTDTGWVSKYIGLPGSQAGCMGGPPTNGNSAAVFHNPYFLTNTVLTNPSMSSLLDFNDGGPIACFGSEVFLEGEWSLVPPSNAPYLWSSEGVLQAHLPTDLGSLADASAALRCPYQGLGDYAGLCSGETTASGDLTHLFFSSNRLAFAEGGLVEAPGSAYDDDLATGTVKKISVLENGEDIHQDPAFAAVPSQGSTEVTKQGGSEEFLRFPAVSTDGSHVLISTATVGTELCSRPGSGGQLGGPQPCPRFTASPLHLYMRINDSATYEIAEDQTTGEPAAVNYVGMTPDGAQVFFTSPEQLIPSEETGANTELYMWSAKAAEEGKEPLTLVSKPNGGSDSTEACNASWVQKCAALPISTYSWANQGQARGGNGISDSAIASANGDVYFYSPAQLDGSRGRVGAQNLYYYAAGEVHYVTSFNPEIYCSNLGEGGCSEGPILRIDVSPNGDHMAFLTASRLTSYDNADHPEMYSYTPATETLVCASCNPSGKVATADVEASQDGLFMTDDGRVFFSTEESLVPADTNEATDVYEFVDGRPQLITPGTGTGTAAASEAALPGLVAVSANGTDVYFATYDSLISEDHNGNFLKFYDARTDGGFPQPPPVQPCAAAEECHGPGTEAPQLAAQGTAATLAGGNADARSTHGNKHHQKTHRRARHKHRHGRAASQHRRGGK